MTLEEYLFRIFSHFAVNTDAFQPEVWKSGTIIRFLKACNILNRSTKQSQISNTGMVLSADVEIIVAKTIKLKEQDNSTKLTYSGNVSITFDEFLLFLHRIAQKCYPYEPSSKESLKRLLLENVLPNTSCRKSLVLSNDMRSTQVLDILNLFEKGLFGIFSYYLDRAENRRNALLASKIAAITSNVSAHNDEQIQTQTQFSPQTPVAVASHHISKLKSATQVHEGHIQFSEYSQFCVDFQLRHLLTANDLVEVYLSITSYDSDIRGTRGLTFDKFLNVILLLSTVSYGTQNEVTPVNQVKALLLYLWKGLNKFGDSTRFHPTSWNSQLTSTSTHLFGTKLFTETFFVLWQKDNFVDYTISLPPPPKTGTQVLQSILENNVGLGAVKHSIDSSEGNAQQATDNSHAADVTPNETKIISIRGNKLAQLFYARPYLRRFVALEIEEYNELS